jgi:hypothetical protein
MKFRNVVLWICLATLPAGAIQGIAAEPGSQALEPVSVSGFAPEREIADGKSLKPGLSAIYIYKFFRHIDEMPVQNPKSTKEKVGKPIPVLNHHFGEKDMIFDSGVSQGVGIQMNGFLKFAEAGKYVMMALSNDGIRVEICGKDILMDPKVHSDRLSPQAVLNIPNPGWYPVMIQYYQRKGTAAIELRWKPPGEADFSVIPADAYAHEPVSAGAS